LLALCQIMQATDAATLDRELAALIRCAGFGGCCVSVLPEGPAISDIWVISCSGNLADLVSVYIAGRMVADDPVIRTAARTGAPVRWSEHFGANAAGGAARLRAMLQDASIPDGITLPAAPVNGRSRTFLAVSAVSNTAPADFETAYAAAEPLLRLAALALGRNPVASKWADAELSNSEILVLSALADGMRPREIAAKLGKSEHTIRNQIVSAQQRLGARTKEQALVTAIRLGLVSL
jgi:DNA-binding CsgD family transcriptional regulator